MCEQVGIQSSVITLDEDISQETLEKHITQLNEDSSIHGILLQLPLPGHLNTQQALEKVHPLKDVDGLTPTNMGRIVLGTPQLLPCTPQGCVHLIQSIVQDVSGLNVCVIGRSVLVGKPLALLLTHLNATVTVLHSKSQGIPEYVKNADIIITAMGKPSFLKGEWLKPRKAFQNHPTLKGVVIIDVGITRQVIDDKQILKGDVDYNSCKDIAAYITPVPGGVGPMTVAYLLKNTLQSYLLQTKAL